MMRKGWIFLFVLAAWPQGASAQNPLPLLP